LKYSIRNELYSQPDLSNISMNSIDELTQDVYSTNKNKRNFDDSDDENDFYIKKTEKKDEFFIYIQEDEEDKDVSYIFIYIFIIILIYLLFRYFLIF
jgi:hypothetical protein